MGILLTNDDGVEREGIRALREALLAAGLPVATVAPEGNRSGASRCVTIHEDVELRAVADGPAPVWACSGSPVDCVRIGLLAEVVPAAAVVASGINHGTNVGDDVGYSGTVGAALEAASLGACGVAFSQQGPAHAVGLVERGIHRFPLAPVAAAIAARVHATPLAGAALNVNLPAGLADGAALEHARLARRVYRRGWLAPRDHDGTAPLRFRPYAGLGDERPAHEDDPAADVEVLLRGRIAVTALPVHVTPEAAAAWLHGLDLPRVAAAALGRADASTPTAEELR